MTAPRRDHLAILLYALERGPMPVPAHVIQLALSAIAAQGFDPAARVALDEALAGRSDEHVAGEQVGAAEYNFLRYANEGWPSGATRADYLRDLRDAVLDPRSGFAICASGSETARLLIVAPPSVGEPGAAWTAVIADAGARHWTDGYRSPSLEAALGRAPQPIEWIREPDL